MLLAGGAGLFAKFLPVPPAVLTAGRTLFGSLALLMYARATATSLRLGGAKELAALALSGALLAAHWFTFFHAIQVSTVAIGLLAFSAFPLFTTFLEPALFREPLRPRDLGTALTVTLGLVLVTPSFDLGDHLTRGLLWGLLSAFAYAFLWRASLPGPAALAGIALLVLGVWLGVRSFSRAAGAAARVVT